MQAAALRAGVARATVFFFATGTFLSASSLGISPSGFGSNAASAAGLRAPLMMRGVQPAFGDSQGDDDGDISDAPAGSAATVDLSETAKPLQAFLDSLGVNTHFSYEGSGYTANFNQAAQMLVQAGLYHIRDGMHEPYENGAYVPRLQALGALGVKGTFFVSEDNALDGHLLYTASEVQGYPALVGSVFGKYEAPNEQDLTGGANWLTNIGPIQRELWNDVHGSQASAGFEVLGPSLTRIAAYQATGDLSAYLDRGNIHDYLYGYNPETTGFHDGQPIGGYGSWWDNIAGTMAAEATVSATKPIQATETGYCTNPNLHTFNNVSLRAQEAYALRLYFEGFAEGVAETDFFQLVDVPQYDGTNFGYCGLLTSALQPKPAYRAIKSLTHLLSDKHSPARLATIGVAASSNCARLHHVLLERSDGTLFLALWRSAHPWIAEQSNPGRDHRTGLRSVSLALRGRAYVTSQYQFDDSGRLRQTYIAQGTQIMSVALDDMVTILQIARR